MAYNHGQQNVFSNYNQMYSNVDQTCINHEDLTVATDINPYSTMRRSVGEESVSLLLSGCQDSAKCLDGPCELSQIVSSDDIFNNNNVVELGSISSRYKTEMCRAYQENGICKYQDKCQFAHGITDLRSVSRHPKYKTQLCKTFHSSGYCKYGQRCHFVHSNYPSQLNTQSSEASSPPLSLTGSNNSSDTHSQRSLVIYCEPSKVIKTMDNTTTSTLSDDLGLYGLNEINNHRLPVFTELSRSNLC